MKPPRTPRVQSETSNGEKLIVFVGYLAFLAV
jgi:hypothetical protein